MSTLLSPSNDTRSCTPHFAVRGPTANMKLNYRPCMYVHVLEERAVLKIGTMREQRMVLLFLSLPKRPMNKKRSKDAGSYDCMKHLLTKSESMLMALRSLHSIGSAPVGVHQRNLHPSKSNACQTVLKRKLTTYEHSHKMRSCARATCTPSLCSWRQNDGMLWHGNAKAKTQDHEQQMVYLFKRKLRYSNVSVNSQTFRVTYCSLTTTLPTSIPPQHKTTWLIHVLFLPRTLPHIHTQVLFVFFLAHSVYASSR